MTATISCSIKLAKQYLFEKRYNKALTLSDTILKDDPACVDALLVKAIVLQKTKQLQESKNILLSLVSINDNFLPGLVVLTQVLIELKDFSEAAKFAEQALQLSPENPALWLDYSNCLYQISSKQKADEAYKKHLIFDAKHPLLRQSLSAFFNGEFAKSERLVRRYLQSNPNDVNALRLLAEMAIQLGILGDAQSLLERTLSLAPDYHLARLNYAHTLNKRERSTQALEQIKLIEKAQPEHMPVQVTKAAILVKLGQYTQASELYSTILDKQTNQPQIWCSKGHVEKTLGNQGAAIKCYQQSIELMPEYGEPYWSLANLKTYQFTDAEIAKMEKVHKNAVNLKDEDNAHLCFALGKAFEANKNIAQSFHYYSIGNKIKKKLEPHDQSQIEQLVKRNINFFNRYTRQASQQHQPSPIFIVGLPRSGSTLLEQILSSHSMVDGTKELPDIMAIARSLSHMRKKDDENRYPQVLEDYSPEQLAELGQKYLNGTEPHRGSAPYFLDKMPNNFLHIGLIKSILPNAKIIDARRHPTATCFSCFKQLFAIGQSYTNSLNDLNHYYRQYLELMNFWQATYPDDILTVQYEDVVESTEIQVRNLLNFLDLPFEESCLSFYENQRPVATASSEQVRQPINKKGLDAWRPFAAHLGELEALSESSTVK